MADSLAKTLKDPVLVMKIRLLLAHLHLYYRDPLQADQLLNDVYNDF